MNTKLATARALTAYVSRRALNFVTAAAWICVGLLCLGVWALAHFSRSWWWLFLIPLAIGMSIFMLLRMMVSRLIQGVHRHPFTSLQKAQFKQFTDKVMGLVEAKSTPLPFFALITLKDLVRHRDASTLRSLISDSKNLKNDFADLERHFGER